MKKLCFLVGRQDSLFKQLVAGLLRDLAENLNIFESNTADFEDLLNEISKMKPHLILLDDASPFSKESFLVGLLINRPNLPVIVLSENSNEMHIVRRETVLLKSSNDLIKAIDQFQPEASGG